MKLTDAEELAWNLLESHGLTPNWSFKFDNAKNRAGQCRHGEKVIRLSRPIVQLNNEAEIRDTLLHEIAHALVGPGKGHGVEWQRKAAAIGARPERCFTDDQKKTPEPKWKAVCLNCRKIVAKRHKLAKSLHYKHHTPCGPINGKLIFTSNGE